MSIVVYHLETTHMFTLDAQHEWFQVDCVSKQDIEDLIRHKYGCIVPNLFYDMQSYCSGNVLCVFCNNATELVIAPVKHITKCFIEHNEMKIEFNIGNFNIAIPQEGISAEEFNKFAQTIQSNIAISIQ